MGQLLPMVAQLPSAQTRCKALARIWAAAVASDLETRRAVRTRQKTLPGAELKQLLSDAFVMEIVSGSAEGALAHAPMANPCSCAPSMQVTYISAACLICCSMGNSRRSGQGCAALLLVVVI